MQQFHFGAFYSYVKLKEQGYWTVHTLHRSLLHFTEARNVVWISECIAQKHKAKIDNYINIF